MISVTVIGYGKVAYHLINAFLKSDTVDLVEVYVRDLAKAKTLDGKVEVTHKIDQLKKAHVYIVAVSDNAITEVSSKLKVTSGLVVHTSGAASINTLQTKVHKGVFYPLQSFSKAKKIDFKKIPFCLEAERDTDFKTLEKLAQSIGQKTYSLNSQQRQYLHVAAVFVNNFTNHLFKVGNDICDAHDIPFEILFPLIRETALKVEKMHPKLAQTGPAIRKDSKTIEIHLERLNEKQQTIYKLLTKSIQNG